MVLTFTPLRSPVVRLGALVFVVMILSAGIAAAKPRDVEVVNTLDNPALIRDVDSPARQPFQAAVEGTMGAGTEGINLFVTVPTGKRLVIEYVSGTCFVPGGQKCIFSVGTIVNNAATSTFHNLQTEVVGPFGSEDLFRAGEQVRIYGDGGTSVTLRADRDQPTGNATVRMSLSGHLVDLP